MKPYIRHIEKRKVSLQVIENETVTENDLLDIWWRYITSNLFCKNEVDPLYLKSFIRVSLQ